MPLSEPSQKTLAGATLAEFTRPGLLFARMRERDTAGIISQLSQGLQREGCVPDLLPFYHTALNQELMASSALESGVAIPHARLSGVKQVQFAFGSTSEPVNWGARGSWPVQLVFLVAVPATDAATYLHLLAALARLGQQPDRLAELRAARNPRSILTVLEQLPVRQV
jgi:fructose PTS system EIIA component